MWGWFGTLPTRYPAGRIRLIPFQGLFTEDNPVEFAFLVLWLGLPTLIVFVAALRHFWQSRGMSYGVALALMGAAFMMIVPGVSWQDPVAAYRIGTVLVITTLLFIGQCYPKHWKLLAAVWTPLYR